MKLNEKQLQQVKGYLNNKDVEYIDLHFEVLDHIASDIETKMEISSVDFETAFDIVKEKWNKNFSYKWSYWLGISNGGSKLFIDYCLRIYKPILFKSLLGLLIIPLCFYWFVGSSNLILLQYKFIINTFFNLFSVLYLLLLLFGNFQLKKTNFNSTYSYLFKKQVYSNLFLVFLFAVNSSFNSQEEFKYSKIIIFSSLISILIMGFILYNNHFKAISNYKKYDLK